MIITPNYKDPSKLVEKNLTFEDIEFSISCLVRKIINSNFLEKKEYKFHWDEIQGDDSRIFIEYLIRNYGINWVKKAKIQRIDDSNILISDVNQFIMLRLNKEKNKAILVIDGKYHDFNLNIDNGDQIINHIEYDPIKNIIIGIDRGGAIVGAMLGKKLHLPATTIAINWAKSQEKLTHRGVETSLEFCGGLKNIDFENVTKILLVDDVIRTGMNMASAKNNLENTIENKEIQYNILCILYQRQMPDYAFKPDLKIYDTKLTEIRMPWDEKEKDLLDDEEFNRHCSPIHLEKIKKKSR